MSTRGGDLVGGAQTRASNKYAAKAYDQIRVVAKKEDRLKERIKLRADQLGLSINAYILQLIESDLNNV